MDDPAHPGKKILVVWGTAKGDEMQHGETYLFLTHQDLQQPASDKLAATDFFVNKSGGEKPSLKYKRPGFTAGGLETHRAMLAGVFSSRPAAM